MSHIIDIFKKGYEVTNPAKWKSVQINANNITSALIAASAIASTFGYDFHISEDVMKNASGGILALFTIFNSVMTVVTSKKAGL